MTTLLTEMGKQLAQRWLATLALPGALFLASCAIAHVLGHGAALDVSSLLSWFGALADQHGSGSPAVILAVAATALLSAAACSFAATALAGAVDRVWTMTGRWAPAHRLTVLRRRRWNRAYDDVRSHIARAVRTPEQGADASQFTDVVQRCSAICLVSPERPTWIADRLRATDVRVHVAYRLDLASAWPRLWLLLTPEVRGEIVAVRGSYDTATRKTAWALMYAGVSLWWWPAAVPAAVLALDGWRQGRRSVETLASLIEAVVDLHVRGLAEATGSATADALVPDEGHRLSLLFRKDDTLHPRQSRTQVGDL